MYRSSPFCSTLNTSYITGFDMCKVCTEAVHSVALWTRATSQDWICVKYVPKQSIPEHFENVPFYTYGFQSVSKNMTSKMQWNENAVHDILGKCNDITDKWGNICILDIYMYIYIHIYTRKRKKYIYNIYMTSHPIESTKSPPKVQKKPLNLASIQFRLQVLTLKLHSSGDIHKSYSPQSLTYTLIWQDSLRPCRHIDFFTQGKWRQLPVKMLQQMFPKYYPLED